MRISEASSRIMDKVYRRGVDVAIAFDVGRKLSQSSAVALKDEPAIPDSTGRSVSGADDPAHESGQHAASPGARARIKGLLRPAARLVYRGLKPFAAPLLFRARRYFTEIPTERLEYLGNSVQMHAQAMDQRFARSDATLHALRGELNATRKLIAQESDSVRMLLSEESRMLQQMTIDELRYTREALAQAGSEIRTGIAALRAEMEGLRSRLEIIESYSFASARRVTLACGPDRVMVRTSVGYVLCPASDYALLALLTETGEVEAGTRKLIQSLLQPGATYVDVGANIGMHVLAAARAMQGRGKIICFEPYAASAALLKESVMINGYAGMLELHQAAVSAAPGRCNLYLGKTSGHHSLFPLPAALNSGAMQAETELLRLDDVIGPQARVDLLKIDAEGAELDVLKGAARLIDANPDIGLIVELGTSHLQRVGVSLADWLAAFESLGFAYRVIHSETGKLEAWSMEQLAQTESVNLFCARPAALARQALGSRNE
jgi:FkbM family methyltransferase